MKKYAVEVLFMSACAGMFLPVFAWGGTDVNIDNPLAECLILPVSVNKANTVYQVRGCIENLLKANMVSNLHCRKIN
ncbi:DUF2195 family protein, partial [Salmonella enterica]|uniref:DUF2195 family protein n=2 Tax=Salmonella enterica TaxID=28901 RepID=UPI001EFB1668